MQPRETFPFRRIRLGHGHDPHLIRVIEGVPPIGKSAARPSTEKDDVNRGGCHPLLFHSPWYPVLQLSAQIMAMYDAVYMRDFYDEYGEREWGRFERRALDLVNFHIHRHYLEEFIHPGDTVLDVGAGPGRFTIELARLGAKVHVGDLSPGQLELNRQKVSEAGYEHAVIGREIMDIVDLSDVGDALFDAVVCYGGPLSYVFDHAGMAIGELLRVTKPGGYLLVSAMSLFGTLSLYLDAAFGLIEQHGLRAGLEDIIATGNLSAEINDGHPMHLFRSAELLELMTGQGAEIVAASAANFLSPGHHEFLAGIVNMPELWDALLAAEIEACKQPGALDGGTHVIAVGQRRDGTA